MFQDKLKKVNYKILLNDAVLAEFSRAEITPESIQISKEYRDENKCDFAKEASYHDIDLTKVNL